MGQFGRVARISGETLTALQGVVTRGPLPTPENAELVWFVYGEFGISERCIITLWYLS